VVKVAFAFSEATLRMTSVGMNKQIEQTLQQITTTSDQAADGIVVIDGGGILRFANLAWAATHGYDTPDELIGKHVSAFHTEEQMNAFVRDFIEEAIRRGQLAGPVDRVRSDGTVFCSQTRMTAARDKEGQVVGLVVVVAAQARTENKLQEHVSKLEQYIEQQADEFAAAAEGFDKALTEQKARADEAVGKAESAAAEAIAKAESQAEASEQRYSKELAAVRTESEATMAKIRAESEAKQASYNEAIAAVRAQLDE